jgi:branched-chain amino acid aminotransferase
MSPFNENGKVWMNGKLVPWKEANIHIASHVIHYGSCLFEGFRAYETPKGSAIFRLDAHIKRLYNSCKMYRMDIPYTQKEFMEAVKETIKVNQLKSCYVRPIVYRGYNTLGVDPFPNPVDSAILVWKWGSYLGEEALEKGVDVKISSWQRMAPNTFPALAKSGANYMNSQLIKMEALLDGYVEGIALNVRGHISEGSGENIFIIIDGMIHTPPLSSSILPGITRDTVIRLAEELNIHSIEETIPREML